jgi:hypothetical protein
MMPISFIILISVFLARKIAKPLISSAKYFGKNNVDIR